MTAHHPSSSFAARRLLKAADVADLLRFNSIDAFYRRIKTLVEDHGFPPAIDGVGNSWDPAAIDLWLDSQMPEHLRAILNQRHGPVHRGPTDGVVEKIEAARLRIHHRLDARLRAGA